MVIKNDIPKQFEVCKKNIYATIPDIVIPQFISYGIYMVTKYLPSHQEFRNLTGNTVTSYAFGVYHDGNQVAVGFNGDYKPPLRNKLIKGEAVYDFTDYDESIRPYFSADINTDGGFGSDSSWTFLNSIRPTGLFSIIFTTGTEYSAYLENILGLNVLSDAFDTAKDNFIKSFKPIR